MNLQPSGFIGCSLAFAIHLVVSQVSHRPISSFLAVATLGSVLTMFAAPVPPPPPNPSTPSVPAFAYMKGR